MDRSGLRSMTRSVFSVGFGQVCVLVILLFMMCPFMFFQEYPKAAHGLVAESKRVRGGYDVKLADGSTILWIVRLELDVSSGDTIKKEPGSFRYTVNGEQILDRDGAMALLLKIPPKTMFVLLPCLNVIAFLYYFCTKKVVLLDVCAKKVGERTSLVAMGVLPAMLICYTAVYLAMSFWT